MTELWDELIFTFFSKYGGSLIQVFHNEPSNFLELPYRNTRGYINE